MSGLRAPVWGQADLHIHTTASDGVASPRDALDWVERSTDLDLIAIADHDEVRGALEARAIARGEGRRVEVVVGTEVTTREGHLIGLFVERRITMFRSLEWTIRAIRDQGGLVVVPHPLSWLTPSVRASRLLELRGCGEGLCPDAVEVLNPSIAGRVRREAALALNRARLGLAEVGGSDAHFRGQIGSARTRFPGRTADDLRRALLERTTEAAPGAKCGSVRVGEIAEQQWRSMLWHPSRKLRRALFPGRVAS